MARRQLGKNTTKPAGESQPLNSRSELTAAERQLLQSVRGDSTSWPAGDPEPFPPPATPQPTRRDPTRARRTTTPVAVPAPPRPEPSSALSTLGQAMVIKGELHADEDLMIAGRVEGSITHTANRLVIGRTAVIKAGIQARNLVVEGLIEGDVTCHGTVVLKETADVTGNIHTQRLNIADGARFNGQVVMGPQQEPAQLKPRRETPR